MKRFLNLLVLFLAVFLASCSLYVPQTASIPLLSKPKEVQLNAGATMYFGGTVSAAFAPAEHVGAQVYASLHPGNLAYAQASLGFWNKSVSNINIELYGGVGYGTGINSVNEDFDYSDLDSKYKLYFAQFNIGQTDLTSASIDYGFGMKVGQFDGQVKYLDDDLNIQRGNNRSILFEPQAFIRLGGERLKVGFQANSCVLFNPRLDDPHFYYLPFNMGITLNYRISKAN